MSTDHQPNRMGGDVESLVREAAHDERAGDALLRAIRPRVCRWALLRTGDEDAAEDVAQEVLIRVHRSIATFDRRSRFDTWLYRVVANVAADASRRSARNRDRRLHLSSRRQPDALLRRNPASSPDEGAVARILGTVLHELSPRQRAAFELVDLQGYSGREAAGMEEIDEATLRVHLSRARSRIRDAIRARAV